ncbi:MAG: hypothetical protein ABSG41_24380 [Bryobacteraceae bacterium]|jgi:hypothetical protein
MSGGTRKGAGRKATPIDLLELEKLCSMYGSDEEIAFFFGVSVQTIVNRRKQPEFAAAMHRGRAMACFRVRRAQMRLLDAGNPTIAVWLGKSLLGQRETSSMRLVLPKNRTARDLGKAAEKVTQAVVRGKITLAEGQKMMGILESQSRIGVTVDLVSRVEKIEENQAAAPVSGPRITGLPDEGAEVPMLPNNPVKGG